MPAFASLSPRLCKVLFCMGAHCHEQEKTVQGGVANVLKKATTRVMDEFKAGI